MNAPYGKQTISTIGGKPEASYKESPRYLRTVTQNGL
jgi:hypothetical protein